MREIKRHFLTFFKNHNFTTNLNCQRKLSIRANTEVTRFARLKGLTVGKVSKYGVFSNPYFLVFVMNVVNLRIQSECGKIRTRKTSVFVHFSHNVSSRFNCLNNVFLRPVTIMLNHNFDKQLNQYRSSDQRCSIEKVFLEISQMSQENICARASFSIMLQALGLQLY